MAKETSAETLLSVSELLNEAEKFKYRDRDLSYKHAIQALELIESGEDKDEIIRALLLIAYAHHQRSEHERFFKVITRVFDLSFLANDPENLAYAYYLSACCYRNLGDFSNSAENFLKGLELESVLDNKETIIRLFNGLGHLYTILGDKEKAMKSLEKAFLYLENTDLPLLRANVLGNQAEVLIELEKYSEAKSNLQNAIEIYEAANDFAGIGVSELRLGKLQFAIGEKEESIALLTTLFERSYDTNFNLGTAVVGGELGLILIETGQFEKAIPIVNRALEMSQMINYQNNQHELYHLKYRIAGWQNDYQSALTYFEKYHELKEKTYTREAEIKLKNAESLNEIQLVKKESELNRLKHVELRKAYEEIEIKNKEITDSIRYAQRIQSAILPDHSLFEESFDEHFILFQPRNIVSGDFYWFHRFNTSEGPMKLIAVADCTGHGVPGSLMTMIGSTLLNQVVSAKGITNPADILEELDSDLALALKSGSVEARDGMDISIALYNEHTMELVVSSAMRPVFIFRNGTGELSDVPAVKRAIGGGHSSSSRFENKYLKLEPEDRVYLFSDGFADQFGGEKGKKLMLRNFRNYLHTTASLTLDEQKKQLHLFFEAWKGDHEQVDDVTVLCFKVK